MKEEKSSVTYSTQGIFWYKGPGNRHRADGPAIEHPSGCKEWWLNGLKHREDGPAIEWPCGKRAYYINDKFISWLEEGFIEFKQLRLLES